MDRRNNNGFSIIALVIGIVFLGMIVAGIIFVRHLMNSAEAITLISRISKYESQISLFKNTYKSIPGDSMNFTPPGNDNEMLDDQLGTCARAPDDKLSNEEKYQFWGHMSMSGMLGDEKYVSYSPESCSGPYDENWAAPAHAGLLWPFIQLDPKAALVYGKENGDKSPIWPYRDNDKKQVFLTFYVNAADAIPFAHKFAKESHAANKIDLVNEYGVDMCKTSGLDSKGQKIPEFVNCADKNAAIAKFEYYVKIK